MTCMAYIEKSFKPESLRLIQIANDICADYMAQGFKLTLRQLYYQFVARAIIPNKQKSYKRLGSIINDARLAGLIDWEAIEDRTRNLETLPHWDSPRDILRACAKQFRFDRWDSQDWRLETWIEKEALVGVVEPVCERYRVPYFACRGYGSQSELWAAGQRFKDYIDCGQKVCVLHLGDHDPSGVDMTRDNEERIRMFTEVTGVHLIRLALNPDQIEQYNPPPNPAKFTDSRAKQYIAKFGRSSWELDALEPKVISDLIETAILNHIDPDRWKEAKAREDAARERISKLADNWKDPK